jgi:hypothetical protein
VDVGPDVEKLQYWAVKYLAWKQSTGSLSMAPRTPEAEVEVSWVELAVILTYKEFITCFHEF